MPKELNLNKLSAEVEKCKLSKLQLAERCGISRVTLDSVLKGKEIGLHKFLKLINVLDVNIGYFFDEDVADVRQVGRDYVEEGKIEHKGIEYNAPVTIDSRLAVENAELKRKLIEAQDKIIKLMEDRK